MKKNVTKIVTLLTVSLVMASCGNGGSSSGKYGGLFGELLNEHYSTDDGDARDKFYWDYNDKLKENPIPLEIDADVPLQTNGVSRVKNPMNFYCDAKTTRGGVYLMGSCLVEPTTEEENYNFNARFELVMFDKDGKAIYSVPLSVYGLEKCSYNKRVVNPVGTEVELNFGVNTKPFYAQKLSAVERLRIVDRSANAKMLEELAKAVKAEEQEYINNQTTK